MAKKESAEAKTGGKVLSREERHWPVRIVPYFGVVIDEPEWQGHTFIGRNPEVALANVRRELARRNPDAVVELDIENPDLVPAVSWKEPVFE